MADRWRHDDPRDRPPPDRPPPDRADWRDLDERRPPIPDRGFGRRYGRDYGAPDWRYGGLSGPGLRSYNPRDDYDRGPYPYDAPYGDGPLYAGGVSYRRARGDFEPPHGEVRPPRRPGEQKPNHRGRGPKNYTRSDDRILEDVCDALTDDPEIDAGNIEVTVSGGEVTFTGTVDTREAKRRAEDSADSVTGVRDVHNRLTIESATDGRTTGTAPGTAGLAPPGPNQRD